MWLWVCVLELGPFLNANAPSPRFPHVARFTRPGTRRRILSKDFMRPNCHPLVHKPDKMPLIYFGFFTLSSDTVLYYLVLFLLFHHFASAK